MKRKFQAGTNRIVGEWQKLWFDLSRALKRLTNLTGGLWMHPKLNPFLLLGILCVTFAISLGGIPPSAVDEDTSSSISFGPLLRGVGGPLEAEEIIDTTNGSVKPETNKEILPEPPKKEPFTTHIVQNGETLTDIAKHYSIDVDTLSAANNLTNINRLKVGQELTVLSVKGALHTVRQGENLWDIAKKYQVDVNKIISTNNLDQPEKLQPKQKLVIPGAKLINAIAASVSAPKSIVSASGRLQRVFEWPVHGRVSSNYGMRWGRMHYGIDIAVSTGTPVRAAFSGRVTFAGSLGGYGLLVKVNHGNGVETRYGHNSKILVKVGQIVEAGQVLARSGNTGVSTGPHVHFEIRKNGTAVNPASYLR
jgi:murein DD-endopeptidase MepM/ murein hydrolase activator NlpD